MQESLGLEVDEHKMVIGLISRLTNQKGLDLVNDVIPGVMDGNTQVVVLGTGDSWYEDAFRSYENQYKGGLGMPVVVSVLIFIIYYIINNTGYKMARDGQWIRGNIRQVWKGKGDCASYGSACVCCAYCIREYRN